MTFSWDSACLNAHILFFLELYTKKDRWGQIKLLSDVYNDPFFIASQASGVLTHTGENLLNIISWNLKKWT